MHDSESATERDREGEKKEKEGKREKGREILNNSAMNELQMLHGCNRKMVLVVLFLQF